MSGLTLGRGARRVFKLLHELSLHVLAVRKYANHTTSVTFHLPQLLLAQGVKLTTRHVRNLLGELVIAGLIDWGAHAVKVRGMGLWGGCLFAVKVRATSEVTPHLCREDWRHNWRDLEGDIDTGRTVKVIQQEISQLHPEAQEKAVYDTLKAWAVSPKNLDSPVTSKAEVLKVDLDNVHSVENIAYRLDDLNCVHSSKRGALIGSLATALSRTLQDRHSRRWYCRLLWAAWRGEVEGRGTVQCLAAALHRLHADLREWPDLRNPAALLVRRMRPSTSMDS